MIAGVGYLAWFGHMGSVGGHLTDIKIWLFARIEEANNIKKYMSESLENCFT
jgi:hypothetical protein